MRANSGAKIARLGNVVGANRDQPAIADLKFAMKLKEAPHAAGDPWDKNFRG